MSCSFSTLVGVRLVLGLIGLVESLQIACAMLASTLAICLASLARVKLRSWLLTALNLEPSSATSPLASKPKAAAQDDELAAGGADRLSVVAPEVGQGLEVGRELAGEPDQLEIAAGLLLEATAGGHPVQVAVEIDLEQDGRMVSRAGPWRQAGRG